MAKTKNKSTRYKNRQKQKAVEFFGGKCQICGYNKCLAALTFHHVDSESKLWNMSRIFYYKWETVLTELEKCILICANCHNEIHQGITEFDKRLVKETMFLICECCKTEFPTKNYSQIYCSPTCSAKMQRKAIRPSKTELKRLIEGKMSWVKIGKRFGVTDNAVRKWARKYQLL